MDAVKVLRGAVWCPAPYGHWISGARCLERLGGGTAILEEMVRLAKVRVGKLIS